LDASGFELRQRPPLQPTAAAQRKPHTNQRLEAAHLLRRVDKASPHLRHPFATHQCAPVWHIYCLIPIERDVALNLNRSVEASAHNDVCSVIRSCDDANPAVANGH